MPRAGALASRQAERQQCAVQAPGEHQGSARAQNHTCGELSSVLSTRARAAPLSVAKTTSVGSRRSWRGAIVTPPRARGVVFPALIGEGSRFFSRSMRRRTASRAPIAEAVPVGLRKSRDLRR
eukprot:scaffold5145_cov99-Isochrysis_galbana.AAC.2